MDANVNSALESVAASEPMVRFDDVSFHYGGEHGTGEGVDHIDLEIASGEMVVLIGRSGCGKTTLTRLVNGLAPSFYEGSLEGAVYVNGVCVSDADLADTAALVGSVFQNPKSQFFNMDTTGELAFGCENQALPREEIQRRVRQACGDLKLDALMGRNIFDLSGGEKQQIACGSAYASQPLVYVLDEPSSNLDRKAICRLHDALARVKAAGRTVVISEHRLYYLMDLADRFVYLDDGIVTAEYSPDELRALGDAGLGELGLRCTDLDDLRDIDAIASGSRKDAVPKRRPADSVPSIEAVDISCGRGGVQILDIERLDLPEGSIIALIGDNGCGKSTLSEVLCGVIPHDGSVAFEGEFLVDKQRSLRSYLVMQDVNRQLFSTTVLDEVMLNSSVDAERARAVLGRLDLGDVAERHPASLSGGQKQRVAIACALCSGRDIIFYDEPTSGLDRAGMERFSEILADVGDQVSTQVIVTHDPELILRSCTHALRMDNGRIVGIYPLDHEGRERILSYFTSKDDVSSSRKRERVSAVGKILGYAGEHKRKTYAAIALMTAGAAASVVPFLVAYHFVRMVLEGQALTLGTAAPGIAAVFVSLMLYAVLYIAGLQFSHRAAYGTLENLRCSLQEKLEAQPLGNAIDAGTGALKKLFIDDIESIELLLAHMIPEGIANLVVPAVAFLVMIAVDWRLALLTAVMLLFGLAATGQMYQVGTDRMGSYFASAKRLNNTIVEYVNGMEVVRMFNRAEEATAKFTESVHDYRDFALAWYKVCWPWMAVYGSIFSMCTLYSLPLGALLIVLGQLDLADYVLCLCLSFGMGSLLSHVIQFAGALPQVNIKIQTLEKAFDLMLLQAGTAGFEGDGHSIRFEDVRFSYGNDQVLKGVSFTAREGQMTALVGPSGSGKSTIAKLIAHYYDIESGAVTLGGQDVRAMSLEALNSQVSYVSQELFLFNKSILENIRMGRPGAGDEEVYAAAAAAQCDEFAKSLPQGYETSAGVAGGMLSGGQRQRIAFARALLKDAPIVVLDEATAYIDPENAAKMNAAVEQLTRNKTVLVIAHRLSLIAHADNIIVMDRGRIVDSGRHDDLMARCRLYRTLWDASTRADAWGLKESVDAGVVDCGEVSSC